MKPFYGKRASISLLGGMLMSFFFVLPLWGEDGDGAAVQSLDPNVSSALGAFNQTLNFNGQIPSFRNSLNQSAPQVTNFFSQCFSNPFQGGANVFANSLGANACGIDTADASMKNFAEQMSRSFAVGGGLGAECPLVAAPETKYSCEDFSKGGGFNQDSLEALLAGVRSSCAALSCRELKFSEVNRELSCLNTQADVMNSQLNSIRKTYTQQIQKMERDLNAFTEIEENRTAQIENLNLRLNGNPQIGLKGIRQVKEEFQRTYDELEQQIRDQDLKTKDIVSKRKGFESVKTSLVGAYARSCFAPQTTGPGGSVTGGNELAFTQSNFLCEKNGTPTSAFEYLKCRFAQNQYKDSRGRRTRNPSSLTKDNARGASGQFEQFLSSMMRKLPAGRSFGELSQGSSVNKVTNFREFKNAFERELQQFDQKGTEVSRFVMATMRRCFLRAETKVRRELKDERSEVRQFALALEKEEADLRAQNNQTMDRLAIQLSEGDKALTGISTRHSVATCKTSKPTTQVACLRSLQNTYLTRLNGSADGQSSFQVPPIPIKGVDPQAVDQVVCTGLISCENALQQRNEQYERELKSLSKFKRNYVINANQAVEKFNQGIASQISSQSSALRDRLKAINSALASLGVSGGIPMENVPAEQLEFDPETGLVRVPQNPVNLIGGISSPPLLDVSGDTFSDALSNLAQGNQDLQQQFAEHTQAISQLQSLSGSCMEEEGLKAAEGFRSAARRFEDRNCFEDADSAGGTSRLQELMAEVGNVVGTQGISGNVSRILRRGQSDLEGGKEQHQRFLASSGEKKDELREVQAQLARVRADLAAVQSRIGDSRASAEESKQIAKYTEELSQLEAQQKALLSGIKKLNKYTGEMKRPTACTALYQDLETELETIRSLYRKRGGGRDPASQRASDPWPTFDSESG